MDSEPLSQPAEADHRESSNLDVDNALDQITSQLPAALNLSDPLRDSQLVLSEADCSPSLETILQDVSLTEEIVNVETMLRELGLSNKHQTHQDPGADQLLTEEKHLWPQGLDSDLSLQSLENVTSQLEDSRSDSEDEVMAASLSKPKFCNMTAPQPPSSYSLGHDTQNDCASDEPSLSHGACKDHISNEFTINKSEAMVLPTIEQDHGLDVEDDLIGSIWDVNFSFPGMTLPIKEDSQSLQHAELSSEIRCDDNNHKEVVPPESYPAQQPAFVKTCSESGDEAQVMHQTFEGSNCLE